MTLLDLAWSILVLPLFAAAVLFASCDPAYASRGRAPTIHPSFVATCAQGDVCAAPAVIHLDASETKADGVERPFHDLAYSWDCGSEFAAPDGPISACVFDRPGEYVVTLRVEREGEAALTAQSITVRDRSAVRVVELPAGRHASVALGAGPGLLTSAPGARAVVTGALSPPDGWTVAGVDLEGGCVSLPPERSRVTFVDVRMTGCRQGALVTQTGGGAKHSDLIAVVRSTLTNAPGVQVPAIFARVARLTVLDSHLDADYYPLRTVHFAGLLVARSRLETRSGRHSVSHLRAWSGSGPPNSPSDGAVFVENELVAPAPDAPIFRTCRSNTCTGPGIAEIRDVIVRNNVLRITGTEPPPSGIGFWVEGSDITIERNTVEALRVNMGTQGTTRLVSQFGAGGDRVHVRDNRMALPRGTRGALDCELRGTGHACERNVIERTP